LEKADVISPHWLRHAHASHALARGAPISLVREGLGHASLVRGLEKLFVNSFELGIGFTVAVILAVLTLVALVLVAAMRELRSAEARADEALDRLATLAGIVTLVSSVQPANADCPMPVTALPSTEEGIVIAPANPALPVIETVPSGFVVVAYPVTRMRVDADADV